MRTNMKIKTSELTGNALDWAVAECLGHSFVFGDTEYTPDGKLYARGGSVERHYSTDWGQGGPIIEREKIDIENTHWEPKVFYAKLLGDEPYGSSRTEGPTLLIAAMRCYVASKLGDEVEVPDELV